MTPTNPIFDSLDKGKLQRMLQIRSEYSDGLITLEEARKRMLQDVGRIRVCCSRAAGKGRGRSR